MGENILFPSVFFESTFVRTILYFCIFSGEPSNGSISYPKFNPKPRSRLLRIWLWRNRNSRKPKVSQVSQPEPRLQFFVKTRHPLAGTQITAEVKSRAKFPAGIELLSFNKQIRQRLAEPHIWWWRSIEVILMFYLNGLCTWYGNADLIFTHLHKQD